MKNIRISIIIPTFNSEASIKTAIDSVLNQDRKDAELIVIDGKSSDYTVKILKSYHNNILYISETDNGIYDAMNKGITMASGEYIIFLGGDDIMLPNTLSSIIPQLKSGNTVYYGNALFPKRNTIYDRKFSSLKLATRNICHQAIFYPAEVFRKYKYNLKYKSHSDYELNLTLWGDKEFSFQYMPVTIAYFNDFQGFSKDGCDNEFESDKLGIIKKNFSYGVYIYASIRRCLSNSMKRRFMK